MHADILRSWETVKAGELQCWKGNSFLKEKKIETITAQFVFFLLWSWVKSLVSYGLSSI